MKSLCNITWEGGFVGWSCPPSLQQPCASRREHCPPCCILHATFGLSSWRMFHFLLSKPSHLLMKAIIAPVTPQQGVSVQPPVGQQPSLSTKLTPEAGRRMDTACVAISAHRVPHGPHCHFRPVGSDFSQSRACGITQPYSKSVQPWRQGSVRNQTHCTLSSTAGAPHADVEFLLPQVILALAMVYHTRQTNLEGSPSITPFSVSVP